MELEDNLFQIMTGSNKFSMLNIDRNTGGEDRAFVDQDSYIQYTFQIGT